MVLGTSLTLLPTILEILIFKKGILFKTLFSHQAETVLQTFNDDAVSGTPWSCAMDLTNHSTGLAHGKCSRNSN